MILRRHLITFLLFMVAIDLFLLSPATQARGEGLWRRLETRRTIIQYKTLSDLKKFDRQIDYSPGVSSLGRIFGSSGSSGSRNALSNKIDALYERVQEILEMRGKMKKVIINLYSNEYQLDQAYYRITKRSCRIRAWYIYESNTVYINVNDVHEGMLAHEIAHAIPLKKRLPLTETLSLKNKRLKKVNSE
ncbi:MAG: hypothetical protein JRJ11_11405 [Deltaproteobacteria bacterium]|nr:hypothetical protein [Deltaproteobacteria bacterium]